MNTSQQYSTLIHDQIKGLQVKKTNTDNGLEILSISLEKEHHFPEHTSPKDAVLFVAEGHITFYIDSQEITLKKHQIFEFKANISHRVFAHENAVFLITR